MTMNKTAKGRTSQKARASSGYLHGFSSTERERLRRQARILEPMVHSGLPFWRRKNLIEVGSGVGAQTEILLRYYPEIAVTCVERSATQIAEARRGLARHPGAKGRVRFAQEDAAHLSFERDTFDGAFLCWILEHVSNPAQVLSEVCRVLVPGSPIVINEVLNATFFVDPYSPKTLKYWMAFNEHQIAIGGDPFVGAKLGNLLQAAGFRDIRTLAKTFHYDNRSPGARAEFIAYWSDLLTSGAPELIAAKRVSREVVDGMRVELDRVARSPNAVFFYSFIQATAIA
jgi:ubiquinone/menaquinone biosynthesis C-methylase UbiE